MILEQSTSNSAEVLDALYQRFFATHSGFSDVTSSHWREIGWHRVSRRAGAWEMRGAGFGDRVERSAFNRLRNVGVRIALGELQRRHSCPPWLWETGLDVARRQRRVFSFDCAKQILSLAQILRAIGSTDSIRPFSATGLRRVCVIGDGYGYLGSLIRTLDAGVNVTSVNLGRGLLFDAYYTAMSMPGAKLGLGRQAGRSGDFVFLPAEDYADLSEMPHDLILNIASMQEMNLAVVRSYLDYIRPADQDGAALFYCCNRREKRLPDGEVVRIDDYGWRDTDVTLFDEACPWYQRYPHGLIPRWSPFDGEIVHRLVRLAPR